MKHLVLTLDRQAALRVIEGARPLAVGGAAEMLDALIASWSGTTDETWFILRDLALRPPEVDPLADRSKQLPLRLPSHRDPVRLRDAVARVGQPVRQLPVVGHEHQPDGVVVEPTHREQVVGQRVVA